ncbi:hypothetical protein GCM10027169_07530 [Gordonia jinhuaensis]|uniref:Uncharacterized protein n=1 Tax=Gordonia jinhuaensis TaxID=1517702 RepID=A0A916WPA7_9ACTN|nr:hypothetical protein [Gordonia jinhuaensis]GGB21538.1 hypothetical protein GCM10011489_07130 [Gordonia jinhuaensis]
MIRRLIAVVVAVAGVVMLVLGCLNATRTASMPPTTYNGKQIAGPYDQLIIDGNWVAIATVGAIMVLCAVFVGFTRSTRPAQ